MEKELFNSIFDLKIKFDIRVTEDECEITEKWVVSNIFVPKPLKTKVDVVNDILKVVHVKNDDSELNIEQRIALTVVENGNLIRVFHFVNTGVIQLPVFLFWRSSVLLVS